MKPEKRIQKEVERAYNLYGAKIYNYAYYSTYSRDDAQDITQEAFLKYAQALTKGTQIENPQAYLYRTVRNISLNHVRKQGREIGEAEFPIDIVEDEKLYSDPQRAALLANQREQVLKATQALPEEQRTALILKEIEGMGYEEIAEVMASNPNAVGSLLTRGRLHFREAYRMSQIDMDNIEEECKTYLPRLSQYIDGKLTENEKNLVDLHLQKCPFCRLAIEEMQESTESYRALVPLIPIAGLGAAISKGVSGASSVAGATAGAITSTATTAAASAGLSLVSKIVIGVAGCLIVAGGTVGGVLGVKRVNENRKEEEQRQIALSAIEQGEAQINTEEAARNAYPSTPFGVVEAAFFAFYNKDYTECRKYITDELWINMNNAPGGIERIYADYFEGKSLQRIELDDEQISDTGSWAYVDIYVYFTDGSNMHNSDIMLERNASGNWVICR